MPLQIYRQGSQIFAAWEPADSESAPTARDFRHQLETCGFLDYYALDDHIREMFQSLSYGKACTFVIADERDCTYEVLVSDDKMQAYITVNPAYGGKSPALPDLIAFLRRNRVVYGVVPTAIEDVLAAGEADHLLIAQGEPPEHGRDASFEPLVTEPAAQGKPRILETDQVDFHDLQLMTIVEQGSPLMRKIPPSKGQAGRNVYKEVLPQRKGQERAFGFGKGSAVALDDPYLLVATTAGQIKVHSNFVSVEPVYQVRMIDYSSGDIHFPGTVIVEKDICSGFMVAATGDIQVAGTVEAAALYAGGDVFVFSGIVGNKQAVIQAAGHIQARFIESATVTVSNSLVISDMLLHSQTAAGTTLEIGAAGTKGQIAGGVTRAGKRIQARILGSPAYTQTQVEVGRAPALVQQLQHIQARLAYYKQHLDEVLKALIYAKSQLASPDYIQVLESLRETWLIKIYALTEQETRVQQSMGDPNLGKIRVLDKIYAGVTVRIGDYSRTFTEDFPGATLYVDSNRKEITIGAVGRY